MDTSYHTPVLVDTVLQYLPTAPDGVYVDGTLGGGGHTEKLLMTLSPVGRVIGFDRDAEAIAFARSRLQQFGERVTFIHDNIANVAQVLRATGIHHIDGLLLDLGVSSHQVDDQSRGFSFQGNGRIDMRMDRGQHMDGWMIINTYSADSLANIFWQYGEERASRKIAKIIVESRMDHPINTTRELSELIERGSGKRFLTKTLARVFQAIRIEINNELENLQKALRGSLEVIRPGGRMVVISYHSLEDRTIKGFFKNEATEIIRSHTKLLPDKSRQPRLKILTKKPIQAAESEIRQNPRARSAKLRVAERV